MNYLHTCIEALNELGTWLNFRIQEYHADNLQSAGGMDFFQKISTLHALNNWHTEHDLILQLKHLSSLLQKVNLENWITNYPQLPDHKGHLEPVSLNLNPNHSFAGIHEWLCCLVSQTPFIIKADENQFQLLKFLNRKLNEINPSLQNLMISDGKLKPAKYIVYIDKQNDSFKNYFAQKKAILIESKPTVAILSGNETPEELYKLGFDTFLNLGQSSKTLRKIFVPEGFDIKRILAAIESFSFVYRNNKYANNYDYHQSVFLMERIPFLDNGFLIVKEDSSNDAPTGCLFYEYYNNLKDIETKLSNGTSIENVICSEESFIKTIKPGTSHFWELENYPDNKDFMKFLLD